uniref:Band 4.1 domain-containing protein n=1 Tax=Timema poppense TaxID=170557 RepID=A0A7R9DM88_TIMPO|nr:unnamed protein product [Timema poppensis]
MFEHVVDGDETIVSWPHHRFITEIRHAFPAGLTLIPGASLHTAEWRLLYANKRYNVCETMVVVAGVRYPEELSLCKPLEPNHLKYNLKDLPGNKKRQQQHQNHGGRGGPNNGVSPPDTNTFIPNHSPSGSTGSLEQSPQPFMCAPVTPTRHQTSTPISSPVGGHVWHVKGSIYNNSFALSQQYSSKEACMNSGTWKKNNQSYGEMNGSYSPYNVNNSLTLEMLNGSLDSSLANSPSQPSPEARNKLLRPRTLVERARINVAWLDSSLSIMEQGVREYDTLCLRFKFYSFYDLNPKYDSVRINQIYEQAKWQLLNEEIDCTEEEMLMFAALQVQVTLQAGVPQPIMDSSNTIVEDDIDAALTDLQVTLEGSHISSSSDIMQIPELFDYLRFIK